MKMVFAGMAFAAFVTTAGTILHVAPSGQDIWTGQKAETVAPDGPFATLQRARDEIRALKKQGALPEGGVTVLVAAGLYELPAALELTHEDSGTDRAPIIYRAVPRAEVRLTGSHTLAGFIPADPAKLSVAPDPAAKGKLFCLDLKAQGISDFGEPGGGWGRFDRNCAELFFNDRPMSLSRWPNNDGLVRVVEPLGVTPVDVRGTKGAKEGCFRYDGDRADRWLHEKDLWCHGWWFWDWADQRQRVTAINPSEKTITLAEPHHAFGYRKGQWYYVYNALSEIDQPGEWCIDRTEGLLYFWPPAPLASSRVTLSCLPHLIALKDTSYVTFQGFLLEGTRNTAVVISGGAGNEIAACTIRNTGVHAVRISGGRENGVTGCDIYNTGNGGIILEGGDRTTLTPCNHYAVNNHIHHYARWTRILQPALGLSGCGIRAAHNLIHDAPHMAVLFGGNDHLMEYNEVHSVCYENNDSGAFYAGRNWSMRGHLIRHNYLHHISGFEGKGCVGIYLDDSFSSATLYGNVFFDVTAAAFIGGGRDNVVDNNLFVECNPALHIDARGMGWSHASITNDMPRSLRAMPYTNALWKARYPATLQTLLDDEPAAPKGNIISRNYVWGGTWDRIEAKARPYQTFTNNVIVPGPFADGVTFQLRPDAAIWTAGFDPIPFDKIGLFNDVKRASWPVVHTPRPRGQRQVEVRN
jgi:hypothetical protein